MNKSTTNITTARKNTLTARGKPSNEAKKETNAVPELNLNFAANHVKDIKTARTPRKRASICIRASNPSFKRTESKIGKSEQQKLDPIVKNAPITAEQAKSIYKSMLTSYEMKEIDRFEEIYYIGQYSKKIQPKNTPINNYGYDDSTHHLKICIGDHFAYRFEIKSIFGKGAFGEVICCLDHKTHQDVALKVIVNTQQMQQQGRVEIAILQHLNGLDPNHKSGVVQNMDSFVFRGHVCATFEVLGKNLYEYSRSIRFNPFSARQIKLVAKKILRGLEFCHSHGVVHCDLKPENVAFIPGSTINCRILDFGSGCFDGTAHFEYIQSRFYRAPEVVLGIPYGPPMDIWSFACIIVEMLTGRPMFPAENEAELIEMQMEVFGIPPEDIIKEGSRSYHFFDENLKPIHKNSKKKKRVPKSIPFRSMMRLADPELVDLLEKCFMWNPDQRITAENALNHHYFEVKKKANIPIGAGRSRIISIR